jgi:hypothetical protein
MFVKAGAWLAFARRSLIRLKKVTAFPLGSSYHGYLITSASH